MAVKDIAARLDDCFQLLTGGSRVALPRQRTLQATIDWSHELLTPAERTLFRRLGVFAGGWTLEAAEVVGAGDPLERHEILELLMRLVDRSLVTSMNTKVVRAIGSWRRCACMRPPDYRKAETRRLSVKAIVTGAWRSPNRLPSNWVAPIRPPGSGGWWPSTTTCAQPSTPVGPTQAGAEAELRLAAALGQFWRLQLRARADAGSPKR